MIRVFDNPKEIKPVWGDRDQINLVRRYERIRNGEEPVRVLKGWETEEDEEDNDEDFRWEKIKIECPFCFYPHTIEVDSKRPSQQNFYNDTNYCAMCEQEFIISPKSEFHILVKPEED